MAYLYAQVGLNDQQDMSACFGEIVINILVPCFILWICNLLVPKILAFGMK